MHGHHHAGEAAGTLAGRRKYIGDETRGRRSERGTTRRGRAPRSWCLALIRGRYRAYACQ